MFALGHIGLTVTGAAALDREADLRWAALLAIAPDLIDKPIAFLGPSVFRHETRGFGHTLLAALLVLLVLGALRPGLKRALTLWCCYAGHLVLDRLWLGNYPVVLFWPFLGAFPKAHSGSVSREMLVYNLAGEVIGLVLLLLLVWRCRLFQGDRLRSFLESGSLPAIGWDSPPAEAVEMAAGAYLAGVRVTDRR
jgi:membrane-bound metal-dependent hydrolase YbcI (DUF457 family)